MMYIFSNYLYIHFTKGRTDLQACACTQNFCGFIKAIELSVSVYFIKFNVTIFETTVKRWEISIIQQCDTLNLVLFVKFLLHRLFVQWSWRIRK